MSNLVSNQIAILAKTLSVDASAPAELVAVLKATAFKGQVSDAQLMALLVVANQYGLNPWTKEIYAFPDKNNGIVPVVGVDGWSRIINSHLQFDGMEFAEDAEWIECIIFRKDRSHPIRVREYMAECKRNGVGPWQSHPRRMLRHKSLIQCARLAFGFVGIYDQDEAERIIEGEFTAMTRSTSKRPDVQAAIPAESSAREDAIKACRDAASKGAEHFRAWWKDTFPKESRTLVSDKVAEFQQIAAKADAKDATTDISDYVEENV